MLTHREIEVLQCLAEGLTLAQIAKRLYISRWTVKTHVERLYLKLGVHNGPAAVAVGYQSGVLKTASDQRV